MDALIRTLAIGLAVIATVALFATHRGAPEVDLAEFGFADDVVAGDVVMVEDSVCGDFECVDVTFRVIRGEHRGRFASQTFTLDSTSPTFEVGDRVRLQYSDGVDPDFAFAFADRERLVVVLGWGVAFGVAVVALGRWKGAAAMVGVGASMVVILGYVLPTLLGGGSPIWVAVIGSSVIAVITLWLTHGITAFSSVALLGTVATLVVVALLSDLAFSMAAITGLASDEATYLTLIPGLDVSGLVLAGAVLGALGALDDVTVTQTSAVWEVRAANPELPPADLLASGLRVGRDHIASTVNTLVLAYAGASMPMLVLFVLSGLSTGAILNSEVIAVEFLRTVVGSMGLVAAVPLTTWMAARVAHALPPGEGGGHFH